MNEAAASSLIHLFGTDMLELIDYFKSLHLNSEWNPVDKWRDVGLEEGRVKVRYCRTGG
jgi:hypothetical protein